MTMTSKLESLSSELLSGIIIPYLLDSRNDLLSLSSCSKNFHQLIFSESCKFCWDISMMSENSEIGICIDDHCPLCPYKRVKSGRTSALSFLAKCPVTRLRLHCFVTDIPDCLFAISQHGCMQDLDIKLSNKSNSPSLEQLLSSSGFTLVPQSFSNLKRLVVDSSHLHHINLSGRMRLLEILGSYLLSLSFCRLSPGGIFSILSSRCPKLIHVRMDKAVSLIDFQAYKNENLISLELSRPNFVINFPLPFPHLQSFKLTPCQRLHPHQVEDLLRSLPPSIEVVDLEIPSSVADVCISGFTRSHSNLRRVVLSGAYDKGTLTRLGVMRLAELCGNTIEEIEITCCQSVHSLGIEGEALEVLGSLFPVLRRVRCMYSDEIVENLPALLLLSSSLRSVVLWEKKKWVGRGRWPAMKAALKAAITSANRHEVTVVLEDVSV